MQHVAFSTLVDNALLLTVLITAFALVLVLPEVTYLLLQQVYKHSRIALAKLRYRKYGRMLRKSRVVHMHR